MRILITIFVLHMVACSSPKGEASGQDRDVILTGLDGTKYYPPSLPVETRQKLDSAASKAAADFSSDPSEEHYIWYGRREAYRYHYPLAMEIFTEGLQRYPASYKLKRHRGHRYMTIRDFDHAIEDLEDAARKMPVTPEIEPDGIPNKLNIPLSTVQFNILYHLGLAYFLKNDYPNAEKTYLKCLEFSDNDDLLCATVDWLYMTYRRQGKTAEAARLLDQIHDQMKIIENDSYFRRLMMYKGNLQPADLLVVEKQEEDPDLVMATQGYGVGNWYLCQGDTTRALEIFRKVVSGQNFPAFGFIAAEKDLVLLSQSKK